MWRNEDVWITLVVFCIVGMACAVCRGNDYTVHVVEPAITDHLVLPDGPLPPVCRQRSGIKLFGCRGQYEPASFVVTAAKPLKAVRVEAGPLRGDGGRWFDPKVDDGQWETVQVGTGYSRETGGGWGQQAGFGWYRIELPSAKQVGKSRFKYLHFSACDEEAWVYLNGRKIFDHTLEKTSLLTSEIWITPFVVSLADVELRGDDLLAVRVGNTGSMGGIWRPVRMVFSNEELTDRQVKTVIEMKTVKR